MLKLFRAYWPHILILVAVAAFGYNIGHIAGKNAKQTELQEAITYLSADNKLKTGQITVYEQDKRIAAEQHVAALQKAIADADTQRQRADQLSVELLQTKAELSKTKNQLKRTINDVVKKDGATFTGIGPDSLRLYRAGLGYPADDLPEAASGAAVYPADAVRARGGLSPAGLLEHSADYGEWCLILRENMAKLNQFYVEGNP
ncbi:hypothetical protein GZ59_24540 [Pectobacterium atrosepticum]|uniref:hypothetical protein n=1 Tax=Pectobacterium atrosepticum TaxID=29471 RepID=UPI0004E83C06|nr:hypothetical protein [Pectobacterium atrosepticum]AIK14251.1 hypothetical protein GZ59_24540 [Pectobacterium atrosepticum]ATY91678.1 hypothetical protein CVS35_15585 [Pectobacterium atrosepticum]KMK81971.1 hypothetical protein KCQ_08001 [Pectobacterium atrosepticum ICMP 1526]QXE15246.1 hypothetical protein DCX48_12410 [Pectobacterium atrosepticum]